MAADGEKGGGDFYSVLGLKKECSEAELRNAYKKLALRWHPDRCSASANSKTMEEAKEKFQQIQAAYAVLSDSNKRFLYDVGIYESDDDENGMGDFLREMAQMMSQTKPNESGHESLEELQQLFEDMFQTDLKMDFRYGPAQWHEATNGRDRFSPSSSTSTSARPPPPRRTVSSCSVSIKRGSASMSSAGSGKAKLDELDPRAAGFCFGLNDSWEPSRGRGCSSSKRRSGQKQKVSSKHDVSS